MKITVLGCGSSGGVPLIGNDWGVCDPDEPRNRRTRVSILAEQGDATVLVDTTPDVRQQLLAANVKKISAILYTHSHADHCHGIDDIRSINWMMKKQIPIYADEVTMQDLQTRFAYAFVPPKTPGQFYRPAVEPNIVTGPFEVQGLKVIPLRLGHGRLTTLGFRFGDFAYTTDCNVISEETYAALAGVKTWIVDCVREEPHPSHAHLALTLEWIARVKPERAYLTHMSQSMDYRTLMATLPKGVEPAYDGLVLEC